MGASPEEQQGTRMPDAITSVNGETEPSSSAAVVRVVVRRGEYHDPVTLMEASEAARSVAGVSHVAVGMAEPLNVLIFAQRHGYEVAADGLAPDDLVIALRASDEAAADEGLAENPDDAVRRAQAGEFEFAPGHERGALGPMVGVISPSMPVWVVENETRGNRAYCNFSEGYGRVLRFGAFGPEVIEQLRWMAAVAAPVIASALERLPAPLDLRAISADAVQMGDEVHNRNRAATAEVLRALAPAFLEVDAPSDDVSAVVRYIAANHYFYLNLSMARGKATADAASGVEHSTIVTTIARNGTEVGVRVSGTGERWFTAPSSTVRGLYFPGYRREDANRDVGDSTITETIGLGGFVMAGAPAIGQVAGGTPQGALGAPP